MPQNFLACDREQELLLPPSLREWLPRDHLAWLLSMPSGSTIWPRLCRLSRRRARAGGA
jgi:hypothetical protein